MDKLESRAASGYVRVVDTTHHSDPTPALRVLSSGPLHGRGASHNPANRFDRIEFVPDPDATPEDEPSPQTIFLRDSSSAVIAHNDSPDVGFSASVNPYRGCEHGCVWCQAGETPILLADGTTRQLAEVRVGDEIYGTIRHGWYRKYVKTRVLAHWQVDKPAYRITLEDGTELVASGEHRFLTLGGWKHVSGTEQGTTRRPHLTRNDKLMGWGGFQPARMATADYKRGYICGILRGDGHLHLHHEFTRTGRPYTSSQFRLAMIDTEALSRTASYLAEFGVGTRRHLFHAATETEMHAIAASCREGVARVRELVRWPSRTEPEWARGFLAGIFDAEGSCSSGGAFRISNTDPGIIEEVLRSLWLWGFGLVIERSPRPRLRPMTVVRLRGGSKENTRFFHLVDPAILRKRNIAGQALKSSARLGIVSIEPLGRKTLFDITTGTGDFIANGIVSHNCYARPTHEYLGFSAGLDFETRILVKEDAPELLRRELASPRWTPQPLAVSGVTDAYQPIERRLGLTRRCLQVLADFRNPAIVITKNYRVTRDIDVLRELAAVDAVAVFLSVTTLDPALVRVMEPRTSTPARRLAAIERLAAAGVPAGVMVAPVVPALTDHELPSIIAAAVDAGAQYAGYVMLRLPHAVAGLFERWLEQHFPDRKDKVLNRIRDLRGGKLNDPRFGSRLRGEGPFAEQVQSLFEVVCRRHGIVGRSPRLSTAAFRRPEAAGEPQLALL